jgi:hypothetical protein
LNSGLPGESSDQITTTSKGPVVKKCDFFDINSKLFYEKNLALPESLERKLCTYVFHFSNM